MGKVLTLQSDFCYIIQVEDKWGLNLRGKEQIREHTSRCGRIGRLLTDWIYEIKKREDVSIVPRFVCMT